MVARFLARAFLLSLAALVLSLAPVQLAAPPPGPWHSAQQRQTVPLTPSPQTSVVDEGPIALLPQKEPQKSAPPFSVQPLDPINRPKVALIIDDMGYSQHIGQQLLHLQLPLNFAFLPQAPYTQELVHLAWQQNRTILVHMPMEPLSTKWKQEPITLNTEDSQQDLKRKVEQMLAAIPQASGVNNHMGSRFTQGRNQMEIVLEIVQQHQLFFVDSFTTGDSLGLSTARSLGIPTAKRDIFLDNEHDVDAICKWLGSVAELARENDSAIAIGHPNQALLSALSSCGPKILDGIEVVSVAELVQ